MAKIGRFSHCHFLGRRDSLTANGPLIAFSTLSGPLPTLQASMTKWRVQSTLPLTSSVSIKWNGIIKWTHVHSWNDYHYQFWFVCPCPPLHFFLSEEIPLSSHSALLCFFSWAFGRYIKQDSQSVWRESLISNKQTSKQTNTINNNLYKDTHRYSLF